MPLFLMRSPVVQFFPMKWPVVSFVLLRGPVVSLFLMRVAHSYFEGGGRGALCHESSSFLFRGPAV